LKKYKIFGENCGFTLWVCTNVVGMISGLTGKNQGFRSGYMDVKKLTLIVFRFIIEYIVA
jgi:hypothetical protein